MSKKSKDKAEKKINPKTETKTKAKKSEQPIKLEQHTYWELDVFDLQKLIKKHFKKDINFAYENEISNGFYYVTQIDLKKDDTEITKELIDDYLENDDYKYERIDYSIWLLIMKDILPEGDYLVSICW